MQKALIIALSLCVPGAARAADPDLKPAQEEAKASFDTDVEPMLKQMNEKCGTQATLKTDFHNFEAAAWGNMSYSSLCGSAVSSIGKMCADRPAYKKVLAKRLTGVSCLFSGAKAADKNEHFNEVVKKNMSLNKGVFVYTMQKDHPNVGDNTKAVVEKALN